MSHTPGPWGVYDGEYHDNSQVCSEADTACMAVIANVVRCKAGLMMPDPDNEGESIEYESYEIGADEQEANARLIAASPCLLAACEYVAAFDGTTLTKEQVHTLAQRCRAAIAKATGSEAANG